MNIYIEEATPEAQEVLENICSHYSSCISETEKSKKLEKFKELILFTDKNAKKICLHNFALARLKIYSLYDEVSIFEEARQTSISQYLQISLKYFY